MKQLKLLDSSREGTWMVYRLTQPTHGLLQANLSFLRKAECDECSQLLKDLSARDKLIKRISKTDCPHPVCENLGCESIQST